MKHQTDKELQKYINKYGCFFMCITYWFFYKFCKTELSYNTLNETWNNAIAKGIISGDVNKDGDMDDSNESLILDKNRLLTLVGIPMKYLGSFPPDTVERNETNYYIGEFFNSRTQFTHFIALDSNLKIEYDPISNSVTGREGKLVSVRVFA